MPTKEPPSDAADPIPGPPPDVTATVSAQTDNTRTVGYLKREPAATEEELPPAPEIRSRVGPYLLQEKLGEGVSCHVYRGWDQTCSRPVALKILNWANV